jgi:hypothetical protein
MWPASTQDGTQGDRRKQMPTYPERWVAIEIGLEARLA